MGEGGGGQRQCPAPTLAKLGERVENSAKKITYFVLMTSGALTTCMDQLLLSDRQVVLVYLRSRKNSIF